MILGLWMDGWIAKLGSSNCGGSQSQICIVLIFGSLHFKHVHKISYLVLVTKSSTNHTASASGAEFGTPWGFALLHWHEELNAQEAAQEGP